MHPFTEYFSDTSIKEHKGGGTFKEKKLSVPANSNRKIYSEISIVIADPQLSGHPLLSVHLVCSRN